MDDQLLKAFRSPFEQATSPARERWELFKIVSCFESEIPTMIFRRSIRPFSQWSANGELELNPNAGLNCVRIFFKDINPKGRKILVSVINVIRRYMYLGMRAHSVKGGEWFISIEDDLRQKILNSMSAEELSTKRFDALSIILQAYPEEYSEILWEELRLQLDQVVQTTIIPFLRVINFQDVLKYCDKGIYLRKLLSFLILQLRQHPFLEHLIREILDPSHKQDVLKEFHHEITKARIVLDLQSLHKLPELPSQVYKVCLDDILQTAQGASKMANASFGIALGTCFYENKCNDPLRTAMDLWRPVEPNHPCSMEIIALAHVLRNNSTIKVIPTDTSLEIKTLIGFIFARRTFFVLARTVLKDVLSQIEAVYLPTSWEYGIAVAEFVKCCNMTLEEGNGALQAKVALSKRVGLDDRADTYYLQLGLSDSLLASSGYDSAIEILEHVLATEKNNASIIVKSSIRLSKAQRRLGKIFPSAKIISVLSDGVQVLDQVGNEMSSAFVEEVMCNMSRADSTMASQSSDAMVASNTAKVAVLRFQEWVKEAEKNNPSRATDLTSLKDSLNDTNKFSKTRRSRSLSDEGEAWEKSFVFSFDGGGVRGLSMLYILKALMLRIKFIEISMDPPALSSYHPCQCPDSISNEVDSTSGYYPCHYLDYMAGTNLGGLIATMLGRLGMNVDDAIHDFKLFASEIFGRPRKLSIDTPTTSIYSKPGYGYKRFEKTIQMIFGKRLANLRHHAGGQQFPSNPRLCKTMIIAPVDSHVESRRRYIFRTYDHPSCTLPGFSTRNPGPADALDIGVIMRAAIPTNSDPIIIGGTVFGQSNHWFQNPALEAYREVQDMQNSINAVTALVSFGNSSGYDLHGFFENPYQDLIVAERDHMSNLTNVSSVHEYLASTMWKQRGRYFRFDVRQTRLEHIELYEWKAMSGTESRFESRPQRSTAEEIRCITEEYISEPEVMIELDRVAEILVRNRRLRSQTDEWEKRLFGRNS